MQAGAGNLDYSVSSLRGLLPPSDASWTKALADMQASEEGVGITEYGPGASLQLSSKGSHEPADPRFRPKQPSPQPAL